MHAVDTLFLGHYMVVGGMADAITLLTIVFILKPPNTLYAP